MKPGRKFVELGASGCTDAELLAILIGTGGKGFSALDCARDILAKYGTLAELMDRPIKELATIRGIGPVKAIRVAAAYELACRLSKQVEANG